MVLEYPPLLRCCPSDGCGVELCELHAREGFCLENGVKFTAFNCLSLLYPAMPETSCSSLWEMQNTEYSGGLIRDLLHGLLNYETVDSVLYRLLNL